ncbi:hypothetical protein OS493_029371 [Desmophyllum pertusum]|uniref:MRH domain-containing protein n=1 Tax=Desmophyllum pertusum TaxID=174260 RepID=A0A9X0CQS6_9CNID|nr:hypothetical protein OS493_029371 [Desmophyllum pertusum]
MMEFRILMEVIGSRSTPLLLTTLSVEVQTTAASAQCRQETDTYLNTSNPYGKDSCVPCGPGLTSEEGSTICHSDCFFTSVKHARIFNLTGLKGAHSIASGPSFTSRGYRYYHLFNMSLCGHPYKMAKCHSNISLSSGKSLSYNMTSPVCRMTVVPDPVVITTQTISLADQLVGIYEDMGDNSTNETTSVFAEKGGPVKNTSTFFLFKFHGSSSSEACPNGRSVWTTVLCDNTVGKGVLDLPARCPDGTCDGCRFEILWRTKFACPICTAFDYSRVRSSCESGKKTITYMWNQPRLCRDGVPLPPPKTSECSILEQSVGSAMKDFKVHFKGGKERGKKILKKIKDMASGRKKEKVTFDDDDDEYLSPYTWIQAKRRSQMTSIKHQRAQGNRLLCNCSKFILRTDQFKK